MHKEEFFQLTYYKSLTKQGYFDLLQFFTIRR